MSKTVAHFIRKSTQLKASFIQNQILNHINYKPVVIFKYESYKDDGGFAEFDNDNIPILNLWDEKAFKSKWFYKYPKLITWEDVKKINEFLGKHKVSIIHFHYGTDAGIYFPFLRENKIVSVVSFYGYDFAELSLDKQDLSFRIRKKIYTDGIIKFYYTIKRKDNKKRKKC